MKKSIIVLLTTSSIALLLTGCIHDFSYGIRGKGPTVKETRDARGFTKINSGASFDVDLTQAPDFKVEVEGQQNILNVLKTEVQNDQTLKIYFDKSVGNYKELKVHIFAPNIDGLTISGSGNLKALNTLTGKALTLDVHGSGDVKIPEATYETLHCEVSGSGSIEISGTATEANFHVSGSGDLKGDDMKCKKVTCSVSGSGNLGCYASESLEAKVTGSGDVHYKGHPTNVVQKSSGSGSISSN